MIRGKKTTLAWVLDPDCMYIIYHGPVAYPLLTLKLKRFRFFPEKFPAAFLFPESFRNIVWEWPAFCFNRRKSLTKKLRVKINFAHSQLFQ